MSDESNLRETINKAHTRDRFWLILFPVTLVSLLIVSLIVLLAITGGVGGADVANLAGVATILLVLPTFFFGLLALLFLIGLIFSVTKIQGVLPQAGKNLRDFLSIGRHYLREAGDASASPILRLQELTAKIKQIGTSLTDRFSQKG